MMPRSRFVQLWVLVTALGVLIACSPTKKERMTITELTTDMTSTCIGRHLVDIPKAFVRLPTSTPYNMFLPLGIDVQQAARMSTEVVATEQTLDMFNKAMEKIIAANRLERTYPPKFPLLDYSEKLSENEVLVRLWHRSLDKEHGSRTTQIHKFVSGIHFFAEAKSYKNDFLPIEKSLKEFTKNISAYEPNTPDQKGFCVGPLLIKGTYAAEEVPSPSFRSKQYPDMILSLGVITYGGRETTLLQRANNPKNLLAIFDVSYSTLRKGSLQVANMGAEELLIKFSGKDREGNPHLEHKMMMETYPKNPSPEQPNIEVQLITGQQGLDGEHHTSSLTDTEAMAMWDAILKSIRLRPGAV